MGPFLSDRHLSRALRRFALSVSAGFTLIEMIIVIAIIGIITVIVIVSQGSFNKSLILSNAAYDMALALRSTESYGISARLSTSADTHLGYGLDFTPGSTFTFFADSYPPNPTNNQGCHPAPANGSDAPDAKWGDCVYSAGQDAIVTTYTLNRGITISDICAYGSGSSRHCVSQAGLSRLDVVFVRPDPAPFFSWGGNGNFNYDSTITSACITLTSPQGGARYVSVAATGEITANAAPCP